MKPTLALVLRVAFAVGVAFTLIKLAIKTPRYISVAINYYILFNSSHGTLLLYLMMTQAAEFILLVINK
jgi:hypothetical protein